MEYLNYILGTIIAVLTIYIAWLSRKTRIIGRNLGRMQAEVEDLHDKVKLLKGGMVQLKNIDLDFSVIENQVEENTQQTISFVNQEIAGVKSDIQALKEEISQLEDNQSSWEESQEEEEE